jgi:hypothetical protein
MRYLAAEYDIKTKSVTKAVGIEVFCNNATSVRAILGLTATLQCKPVSSVSTVSGYGPDDRAIGVRSRQRQEIFPLASASRPVLRPTQPPVQWAPGVLCPRLKRGRGVTLTTHPHLVPRSRMSRSYSPPKHLRGVQWDVAFLTTLQSLHNDAP